MQLSDESVERFRVAYKEAYGVDVSVDEARQMAQRVMLLYETLAKPLPAEASAPPQHQGPHTDPPHART